MNKNRILTGSLTLACLALMGVLFVYQVRLALNPSHPIAFERPPVAFGYAWRNVYVSGVVYNNEGHNNIGAGKVVAVSFDGGPIRGTGVTTSTGFYLIPNLSHSGGGVVVSAFIEDGTATGATVTTLSGGNLTNFDIFRNRLIARADSGSFVLTNTHLATADNLADRSLTEVFTVNGTTLSVHGSRGLVVWQNDGFTPGGSAQVSSGVTVRGALTPQSNTITLSGAWVKWSGATFTRGTSTVRLNGVHQAMSGSTIFQNLSKITAIPATLTVQSGTTIAMSGTLTLQGDAGNLLSLRSSVAGNNWRINPDSTKSVQYLDVQNSVNVNASVIDCLTGCVDSDNNVNWNFGTFRVTGNAYSNEGVTPLSGKVVALSINGGTVAGTDTTTASGYYSISGLTYTGGIVVSVFLQNETENAITSTILGTTTLTGLDLYQNHLITRSDSGSFPLTGTHLAIADNLNDDDIRSVFGVEADGTLSMGADTELFVWVGDTYIPGGLVKAHDVDVRGTLTMSTFGLTSSGSLSATGSLTTSTGILLKSVSTTEFLHVPGETLQNLTIDNGLWSLWKLDDGTGSTVRDSGPHHSNGALNGVTLGQSGTGWVTGNSGILLYHNPFAIRLDGTNDFIDAQNVNNAGDTQSFTLMTWVYRERIGADEAIVAKRTGTGTAAQGYILWLDDADNRVRFSGSDGTDEFIVTSDATVGSGSWTHLAVIWNEQSESATRLYINGSLASGTQSGTLASVGSLSNGEDLRFGTDSDGDMDFKGRLDDIRMYKRALGAQEIAAVAAGNKATGSGVYILQSALDVDGDLRIYAGTLDVSAGSRAVTLSGSLNNQAGFSKQSGTVTLDGTTQTLSGSTVFHTLSKIYLFGSTLFFDHTSKQSVSGSLTLKGTGSNLLNIRSTHSGSLARLVLDEQSGTQSLQYLNVRDSDARFGATLACATQCTDSFNNFNWTFVCGNGLTETGEACDDGDTSSGDGCSATCTVETGYECSGTPSSCSVDCGDGIVTGAEDCDEGNANSNNPNATCRTDCTQRRCGDGIRDTSESCDDGNLSNTDACLNTCAEPTCGDTFIRAGVEQCEPPDTTACASNCLFKTGGGGGGGGSRSSSSAATSYYKLPTPPEGCGNAIFEPAKGEQCDEGRFNNLGTCSIDCKLRYCGDGAVNPEIGEQCEPTPMAGSNGEKLFIVASCGDVCSAPDKDGIGGCKRLFLQSCEAGGSSSSTSPIDGLFGSSSGEASSSDFTLVEPVIPRVSLCGDGERSDGEECDDGNTEDGDKCTSSCEISEGAELVCGDGTVMEIEECDDGNNLSGDGCTALCQTELIPAGCGNGIVDSDEQCDDGLANSDVLSNACRTDCKRAQCGDFVIDNGEKCDEGTGNSNITPDRCRQDCSMPRCGDSVTDKKEECDGGFSCTASCLRSMRSLLCGNAKLDVGEECDDGNNRDKDGCTALCRYESDISGIGICGNGLLEGSEGCDDGNIAVDDGCSNLCTREVRLAGKRPAAPEAHTPPPPPYQMPPVAYVGGMAPPISPAQTPIGDTGPGAILLLVTGAAGGLAVLRRRRG